MEALHVGLNGNRLGVVQNGEDGAVLLHHYPFGLAEEFGAGLGLARRCCFGEQPVVSRPAVSAVVVTVARRQNIEERRGVVVVGMDPGGLFGGETAGIVRNFIRQTGITFPVAFDHKGSYKLFRGLGGAGLAPFPLDVIISADGRIVHVSRKFEPKRMQTVIERLLAAK